MLLGRWMELVTSLDGRGSSLSRYLTIQFAIHMLADHCVGLAHYCYRSLVLPFGPQLPGHSYFLNACGKNTPARPTSRGHRCAQRRNVPVALCHGSFQGHRSMALLLVFRRVLVAVVHLVALLGSYISCNHSMSSINQTPRSPPSSLILVMQLRRRSYSLFPRTSSRPSLPS